MAEVRNERQRLALVALQEPEGLDAYLYHFLLWAEAQHYSPSTVYSFTYHLTAFTRWCQERELGRFEEVDLAMLQRYQRQFSRRRGRAGERVSPVTIASVITSLRILFRYLFKQGVIPSNPASELKAPKLGQRLPRHVLDPQQVEHLMIQPDVSNPLGLRDRAMLETIYSTGVRVGEVVKLEVSDLDFSRGTVLVRWGKGKKDRLLPLGVRAASWLKRYLEQSRPILCPSPDERALFVSKRYRKGLSKSYVGRLVSEYLHSAGLGGRGAAHLLRHTMATAMLENGADIRYIQQMLGHSLLSTTQLYTRVALSKLKQVHSATHPAEQSRTARLLREARGHEEDCGRA